MRHQSVVIAVGIAIAPDLTPDHAAVAADLLTDRLIGPLRVESAHDRDAFIEAESMTTSTWQIEIAGIGHSAAASAID